jgi:hypothetical protein
MLYGAFQAVGGTKLQPKETIMSAFMCSKETIDDVVTMLIPSAMTGDDTGSNQGMALILLNAAALEERYGLTTEERTEYNNMAFNYEYTEGKQSEVQVLKSARCFNYQCSEGVVPETKLYKRLEKTIEVFTEVLSKGKTVQRWGEMVPYIEGEDDAQWGR